MKNLLLGLSFCIISHLVIGQEVNNNDSLPKRPKRTTFGILASAGINHFSFNSVSGNLTEQNGPVYSAGFFMNRKMGEHLGLNLQFKYTSRNAGFNYQSDNTSIDFNAGLPFCLELPLRVDYIFLRKDKHPFLTIGTGIGLGAGTVDNRKQFYRGPNNDNVQIRFNESGFLYAFIPLVISTPLFTNAKQKTLSCFADLNYDLNLNQKSAEGMYSGPNTSIDLLIDKIQFISISIGLYYTL
jgi:hypothetical protein